MTNYNEQYELDPETELTIDPAQLDVEWFRQPDLFLRYARAAAEAEKVAKEAHETVKIVRSELIKKANTAPDNCLGEKVKATAGNVEAYYREHPDHIAAKEAQISAEFDRDIMQAAKSAIYMKKTTLENLVRLAVQGWFAAPVTPHTLEEMKERVGGVDDKTIENRIRARQKKKMSRGK